MREGVVSSLNLIEAVAGHIGSIRSVLDTADPRTGQLIITIHDAEPHSAPPINASKPGLIHRGLVLVVSIPERHHFRLNALQFGSQVGLAGSA